MSDTPRTDAECGWYDPNGIRYPDPTGDHVDPDFARQLERELATVTANALALSQSNAELRSRIRRLEEHAHRLEVFGDVLDGLIEVPSPNCSCHISPPCNDCVENGGFRLAKLEWMQAKEAKP